MSMAFSFFHCALLFLRLLTRSLPFSYATFRRCPPLHFVHSEASSRAAHPHFHSFIDSQSKLRISAKTAPLSASFVVLLPFRKRPPTDYSFDFSSGAPGSLFGGKLRYPWVFDDVRRPKRRPPKIFLRDNLDFQFCFCTCFFLLVSVSAPVSLCVFPTPTAAGKRSLRLRFRFISFES